MSQTTLMPRQETTTDAAPGHPAGAHVLTELGLWSLQLSRGEVQGDGCALGAGEHFAVERLGVRAAGLGHASATGDLHATDRRARVLGERGRTVREWAFADLADLSVLGNWGGLVLVHPGGETELVVSASPKPPSWRDAAGWLKVEGAFAAGHGRLQRWLSDVERRLGG